MLYYLVALLDNLLSFACKLVTLTLFFCYCMCKHHKKLLAWLAAMVVFGVIYSAELNGAPFVLAQLACALLTYGVILVGGLLFLMAAVDIVHGIRAQMNRD